MSKEIEELRSMLAELADYTEDVLTGPIMSQFVKWPKNFPDTHPLLSKARTLLSERQAL